MKKCTRCGVEKPKSEFSKHARSKDGLSNWCKACASQYDKEYREKHKAEISEKGKIKYQNNRDVILEKQRQHYQDNKDKYKQYREENKERIKEWQSEYRKTHKEESREYQRKYYQRTAEQQRQKRRSKCEEIRSLKEVCVKCGETRSYAIDFHHINPSEKEFDLSQIPYVSEERLVNELKKCVCLCRNCHAEYHWIYGNKPESPVESLEEYLGENPYNLTVSP